jgi:hypothetical protein
VDHGTIHPTSAARRRRFPSKRLTSPPKAAANSCLRSWTSASKRVIFHADLAFFVGPVQRGGLLAAALVGKDVPAGGRHLSGRQAPFSIGEPGIRVTLTPLIRQNSLSISAMSWRSALGADFRCAECVSIACCVSVAMSGVEDCSKQNWPNISPLPASASRIRRKYSGCNIRPSIAGNIRQSRMWCGRSTQENYR